MSHSSNKEELKKCLDALSSAMNLKPMTEEVCFRVIDHVLHDSEYNGVRGMNGWECHMRGIITERELRNLVMAHSATKISSFNGINEPSCNKYTSQSLCNAFEISLFGRLVKLNEIDVLDSWEKNV